MLEGRSAKQGAAAESFSNMWSSSRKLLGVFVLMSCIVYGWITPVVSGPADRHTWQNAGLETPRIQRMAPDFKTRTMSGDPVRLSSLRGKVVILHFWATFCAPCRGEMEELERLQRGYETEKLVVLTISIDSLDSSVLTFLEKAKVHSLLVARDRSEELRSAYNVEAIPMTYIIDYRGRVVARKKGTGRWNSPKMKKALNNALEP